MCNDQAYFNTKSGGVCRFGPKRKFLPFYPETSPISWKTYRHLLRLVYYVKRVTRLIDWKSPIPEAYFPKMDSVVASRGWPARVANQTLSNLDREVDELKQDVDDLYRWRDRIFNAIHQGYVVDEEGNKIELTPLEGIDVLGNIIEASIISPNLAYYGNFHNMGHNFLAYIHDPDHTHLESFGIMGDPTTAMRDPIFYRWHAYIDSVFQVFKSTLPRYSFNELNYDGVTVTNVTVQSQDNAPNTLKTFWLQSDINLSRGMDFFPRGPITIRFTHLQHQCFTYNIIVKNQGERRMGTCRIFLAPKNDERGNPSRFDDQRHMFIELDKFPVNLEPGTNTIQRHSSESSLTIPFERTFRDVDTNRPEGGDQLERFNFCGCGWPDHLLIPKGTPEGFPCQLFVMISNYAEDWVEQEVSKTCKNAYIFCGIKDKLYPDKKPMGYPFDRVPRNGAITLQQFLTPNMHVQEISIVHSDRTFKRQPKN